MWRQPDVILAQPVPPRKRWHRHQKPLEVVVYLMHSLDGQWAVYDPFAGSGTTLLAALERDVDEDFAMEIDERYVQASLDRCPGEAVKVVKTRNRALADCPGPRWKSATSASGRWRPKECPAERLGEEVGIDGSLISRIVRGLR